ncbi:universal stress protein [Marinovum sp. 2_MG-2023]|uniref:universal stress protein n=1 Tax=unclassified Marinovum TaxID=2647166 RepID=UPI0026E1DE3A|nr:MULTISPECIES: universal stress protein [unclassified Marinovum]MDO6731699.1 universal stress protein [Marinovum sp. 2_MG-2023]MDO6780951.1 universal stress protein [Marinovum sp. 1_MG-2023]
MYNHILIPVAPGHYEEYTNALTVTRKLSNTGAKVSILSVVEDVPIYVETYLPNDQVEQAKVEIANELKAQFAKDEVEIHVIDAHPANGILDWATQNAVDCIVVTSHRPGISDYFIGSTAARVVRHAQCPVVVLR